MNTILLEPTDVLFFRDGRPMNDSLAGHGDTWPLPNALNAALHASLHRAGLEGSHLHRRGRSSNRPQDADRDRLFGSLVTAGPFPVCPRGQWFFPRPADAQEPNSTKVTLKPIQKTDCSLPELLTHAVANTQPPTKQKPEPWWNHALWEAYLRGDDKGPEIHLHSPFYDTEQAIGIGIDPETGIQDGENIYSAHYLRLRKGWRLGMFARAEDKLRNDPTQASDLIQRVFPDEGTRTTIVLGGQQRLCSVERTTAQSHQLPIGPEIKGRRVKWVLLTPSIWPKIGDHHGGWLPSWVDRKTGIVSLKNGPGKNFAERHRVSEGSNIEGVNLVAAIVGKPVVVAGYATSDKADPQRKTGGKSTHLAVPAGSVYYFEAETPEQASALATTLNWHGEDTTGSTINNRRSSIMGEKGFGLGVCGTWEFHNGVLPGHPTS